MRFRLIMSVTLFFLLLSVLLGSCNRDNSRVSKGSEPIYGQDPESLQIEYIAHASFILTHGSHSILLDPYADTVWISYSFPKGIAADAIFSTHPHYDHDGGIFRNLKPYWQGEIPFYQDPGEYEIGNFDILGLKGKHCDPYGKEFGQKNTIFIFDVAGLRLVHWGDNGAITDALAKDLHDVDILMLPIDDTYHILKEQEIIDIVQRVNPKVIVPMHYRIDQLEPVVGKPKNLGPVDQYLSKQDHVRRLPGNITTIDPSSFGENLEYLVFKHSPKVN